MSTLVRTLRVAGRVAGTAWSQLAPMCARSASTFMTKYQAEVAKRAEQGIVTKPLDAEFTASLVELMQDPPADEERALYELLSQRVPPGVDEAAYVKAGFLAAIAKGEASSPLVTPPQAEYLLGTMQGGYNIQPLVDALDKPDLAEIAADALSKTILMFDAFHDVEEKAKAGRGGEAGCDAVVGSRRVVPRRGRRCRRR